MDDDVPNPATAGAEEEPRGSDAFESVADLRLVRPSRELAFSSQGISLLPQSAKTAVALIAIVPLVALLLIFHELSANNSIMYSIRSHVPFNLLGTRGYPFQIRGGNFNGPYNGGGDGNGEVSGGVVSPSTEVPTVYTSQATSADAEAGQVTQMLNTAANDRKSVVAAVTDAQQCGSGQGLQTDLNAIQAAQSDKQNLGSQAANLDLSAIDTTGQLSVDLSGALDSSATADGDFASWIQDLQQQCTQAQATQDNNYVTAGNDSDGATRAKTTLLQLWNTIAPQYGQPTWTESQI